MTKIKAFMLSAFLIFSTILSSGCFADKPVNDDISILKTASAKLEIASVADSDLILPAVIEGYDGITVSYQSENPDILTDDGKVNRQKQDTSVKLTAKLKLNTTEYKKNFLIKIPALIPDTILTLSEFSLYSAETINSVSVTLTLKGDIIAYGDAETRKTTLTLSYLNDGEKVEKEYFSGAKTGFEFKINLDSLSEQEFTTAHMTFKLKEDDHDPRTMTPSFKEYAKAYGITENAAVVNIFEIVGESGYAVLKVSKTDYCDDILLSPTIKVMSDAASLYNSSLKESLTLLTDDAILPELCDGYGSEIIWTTSDAGVITSKGKITRPPMGDADGGAILTATFKNGGKSLIKTFAVTVKARTTSIERFDGVRIYQTASQVNNYYAKLGDQSFSSANASGALIDVDKTNTGGEIQGFGGMLSHGTAYLLYNTDAKKRADILKELFSEDGAGLNVIRLPIGACDFPTYVGAEYDANGIRTKDGVLENFSLCDQKGEIDLLEHFSIATDLQELIPVIKEIMEINPNVIFAATPWTAPSWMKTSNSLCGGWLKGPSNDVNYEPTYAEYLSKYLLAYAQQGIQIEYLSLQNEAKHQANSYPTMQMHQETQKRLSKLLGEKFKQNGLTTKLIILDHNTDMADYALDVLSDAEARQYIGGVGVHGYSGGLTSMDQSKNKYAALGKSEYRGFVDEIKEAYPDTEFYFTEITAGNSGSFDGNLNWASKNIILPSINIGAKFTLYFNFVLDENGMPFIRQDWLDRGYNCVGLAELNSNGNVALKPEYYALKHVSKHSQAVKSTVDGKTRMHLAKSINVSITESNLNAAATITAEGKIALTVNNSSSSDKKISIKYDGKYLNFTVVRNSLTTFVWYD